MYTKLKLQYFELKSLKNILNLCFSLLKLFYHQLFLPSFMRKYYQTRTPILHLLMHTPASKLASDECAIPRTFIFHVLYISEMKRTVESFNRKLTERQLLDNSRETQRSWIHNNLCRFYCAFLLTVCRPERIICRATERTIRNWLTGSLWFLIF